MSVIKSEINSNPDFWNQPYYRLTKNLACWIGQWPYQSARQLIIHRGIVLFIFAVQVIPELIAFRHYYNDFDLMMEYCGVLLIQIIMVINTETCYLKLNEMKLLLENVKENWNMLSENTGRHKLEEHSENGRRLIASYIGTMLSAAVLFSSEPFQLKLINYMFIKNYTVPDFYTEMEFPSFVNVEQYRYPLIVLTIICAMTVVSGIITFDSLFFLYTHHLCGMFAAIGYAIENIPVSGYDQIDDLEVDFVKKCIKLHKRAIKFSSSLNKIIIWNFFSLLGVNMMLMSLAIFQVVVLATTIEEIMRYIMFTSAGVTHLFVLCLASQKVVDFSLDIQMHIEYSKWYESSNRTQKLLKLMMLRCQIPCQLTAGKMIVMSLDTFTVISKASMSYFTLFLAIR